MAVCRRSLAEFPSPVQSSHQHSSLEENTSAPDGVALSPSRLQRLSAAPRGELNSHGKTNSYKDHHSANQINTSLRRQLVFV